MALTHCALIQAVDVAPSRFSSLESQFDDGLRLFAAFLHLLTDSTPPIYDLVQSSPRAAVRRAVGQVPELTHLFGRSGSDPPSRGASLELARPTALANIWPSGYGRASGAGPLVGGDP